MPPTLKRPSKPELHRDDSSTSQLSIEKVHFKSLWSLRSVLSQQRIKLNRSQIVTMIFISRMRLSI